MADSEGVTERAPPLVPRFHSLTAHSRQQTPARYSRMSYDEGTCGACGLPRDIFTQASHMMSLSVLGASIWDFCRAAVVMDKTRYTFLMPISRPTITSHQFSI